mmetsp:Transcript_17751/g.33695  ORF Transcript_17751/g.33695 Transcript_17751/m.33695 type:complete len:554 (+) Transcript_17751:248-1909(+)
MGDIAIRKPFNPVGLDKAELRTKVGANKAEASRGQDGNGKASHGNQHTRGIVRELNQGQKTASQMHQGNGFPELGITHQETMGHHGFSKGKGRHVDTVVTERRQDEKGGGSQGVRHGKVYQVGVTNVFLHLVVEESGQPNPPGVQKVKCRLGTERSQKVVARPSVVACVAPRHKLSIRVPSLGVDHVVQLHDGAAFLVHFTRKVFNPVQFAVVIKAHRTVHVQNLVQRFMLQVEMRAYHFVGRESHQDTVARAKGQEPKWTVLVRGVEDRVRVDRLFGANGCHIDFIHGNNGHNIKMMGLEDATEGSQDTTIIFQRVRSLIRTFLFVRPNVRSLGGGRNVLVDPRAQLVDAFLVGHGGHDTAITSDKESGHEAVAHQDGINHQRHEPNTVHSQHPWLGTNVRVHVRLFLTNVVRQVLQSVTSGNGETTHIEGAQFIARKGHCLRRNLQATVDIGRVQDCRRNGHRQTNQRHVRVDGNFQVKDGSRELQSSPYAQTRREDMKKDVQIVTMEWVEFVGDVLVRGFAHKDGRRRPNGRVRGLFLLVRHGLQRCNKL